MCPPKPPLDGFPYERDPRSQPLTISIEDGNYVYVQDLNGTVFVLPDGSHLHPKVLAKGSPAMYAGDLQIKMGTVVDVTNLSGSFQFDEPQGLLAVAMQIESPGIAMASGAVRFFPMDGSQPYILK